MEFTHVINQMLVLCVPILAGYLAARLGYLDEDLNTKLSRLIVNIALPCLVVGSAFGTDGLPDAPVVLELMFYSAIGYAIAYLLALAIPALVRSSAAERGIYRFVVVFGNVGFIGYPVLSAIYGPRAVLYAAIAAIPESLILYSAGEQMIRDSAALRAADGTTAGTAGGDSELAWGQKIVSFLKSCVNPTFIASLVLVALVLLRVDNLGFLGSGMQVVGNLTTPAALLVTGGTLAGYEPVSMLSNWRAYVAAIARLLIVPVAMLLVLRSLIADDFVRGVVVIGAAMPVASVGVLFCLAYGADTKPMMQSTFVAIIASVISIPLLALIV